MVIKNKILSIDDSTTIRKIIRKNIETLGFEFLEAADGNEGILIVQKYFDEICLILLDWNMPGMNGLEFLKIIKQDKIYNSLPVIMVTTESEKENIIKTIQIGVCNYILKPFTDEELIQKIKPFVWRI